MIGRLSGTLAAKQPPQIVIDVNGVGYEVDVPMSTSMTIWGGCLAARVPLKRPIIGGILC